MSIEGAADLGDVVRSLHSTGIDTFFEFSPRPDRTDPTRYRGELHPPFVGLPASGKDQERYRVHVARVLVLSGDDEPTAARLAGEVLAIERLLAPRIPPYQDRFDAARSEHPLSSAELHALASHFDWSAYLASVGSPEGRPINVTAPAYFEALDDVLAHRPLPALRAYLRHDMLVHSGGPSRRISSRSSSASTARCRRRVVRSAVWRR